MVPSSLADTTTTRARYMKVFAEDEIACLKTTWAGNASKTKGK